ncbi:MAG TPA: tetratricopeptide repeat protein, partial [Pyrinomonadaceae bacterium]
MRQRCPILLSLALISGFLFPSIILAHTRSPSSRWPVVAAQDDKDVRALVRDHRVERSLESKQLHVYRIPAAVGHFLSIAVEQPDTDVVVALFAPDGAKVFQTTSADFRLNRTRVYAIANQVGDYRMEVRAFDQGAPAGRYSITLDALRQATATDKSRVAARGFLEKANSEWRWGNPETFRKAVESYVEALALWRAVEDKNGEADTLAFLSHAYRNLGDYPNAVQSAEAALHVSKAIGDHTGEAWATALLAEAFAGMGQVDKQLEYFYKTLHIHHNAGNKRGEASALLGLGQYHLGSADYQKALEFIAQSLSLSRSINNRPREARALFNLGLAYWLIGDYQESLEAYRQCLPYYQAVGDVVQAMSILDNMGLVYYALGEYQKALDCYAQTLADRRSRNQHSAVADTLTGIGTVYAAMGQNQQALENLNQALTIYREVGNRTGVPYALRNIASVYISLKDPGKALDYFNEALPEDRALRDQPAEIKALSGLAMAHRDLGNLNKARTYIEEALDIVESLRSRLTSQELRAAFFASKWSYYQFYIDLLMRLNQQKPDAKFDAAALQASERARARSLLDLLAEAKVDLSEGIDPALKQKEKEIQGRITRANGQLIQALSASPVNKDLVAQLNEELKQTENSREQLEVQIRKAHPKYAELKYPTPLKLEAIQDLLDEHTALLEYSLGQDRSFLFVVSKQGLKSYALPPAAEINKLVQEVRSTVEQPGRREFGSFVSRSRKLYDVLIAPATNELKEKRNLLIAPDGALYYLPFEALLTGLPQSEQGEMSYLLKRWGVSYVPSASVLANLRQSQKQAEKKPGRREFVAFADP